MIVFYPGYPVILSKFFFSQTLWLKFIEPRAFFAKIEACPRGFRGLLRQAGVYPL
jgi:hypothetical protein